MKRPVPIRSILDETLRALEIETPLKVHRIWVAWGEIVGEAVSLHAQPRSLRNRILFIDVSHPTWIQQLQFLKPTLLEKINTYLGEPLIEEIRFKLGKIVPPASTPPKGRPPSPQDVDEETVRQINNLLGRIGDPELRQGLREIFLRSAGLEQKRKPPRK